MKMTKRYKTVAIIVMIVMIFVSAYSGVLAAQKLDSLAFGSLIEYASLDELSEDVGMVNILLIGVDEGGVRSDTIILASIDGYSDRVSLLSVPRDTRIEVNGSVQKINAVMAIAEANSTPSPSPIAEENSEPAQEPDDEATTPSTLSTTSGYEEVLIEEIKQITGLPIHYFITVDFDGFIDLVDALDGIDFNVPYDMDYDDPAQNLSIHLTAGQQHLDGKHAHDFVRFRHNNDGSAPGEYVMGDEGRMYWQQEFIKELMRQKLNPTYLSRIDDVYEVFQNNVRTNLTFTELVRNLNAIMKINIDDITAYQLPGESQYISPLWYYIYDPAETEKMIEDVFTPQSREEWEAYLEEQRTAVTASPSPTDDTEDE